MSARPDRRVSSNTRGDISGEATPGAPQREHQDEHDQTADPVAQYRLAQEFEAEVVTQAGDLEDRQNQAEKQENTE